MSRSKLANVQNQNHIEERKKEIKLPLNLKNIEKYLKCSRTYIGSIFANSFKKILLKIDEYSIIVNCKLEWFCIYSTKNTFEIFDPSGVLNKMKLFGKKFLSFLKCHTSGKILYCNPKLQSKSSKYCSLYIIFYIKMREMGHSFQDILRKFSKKYKKNDKLVKQYMDKIISV